MEPYAHLGRLKGRMTRLTNKIREETDPNIDFTDEKTLYDQSYNVVEQILAEDIEYVAEEDEPEVEAGVVEAEAEADDVASSSSSPNASHQEASVHPSEDLLPLRCFHCATILSERTSNSDLYGFGPDGAPVVTGMCQQCRRPSEVMHYDVTFRGPRLGIMLSELTWTYKSHSSVIIDQNYNPSQAGQPLEASDQGRLEAEMRLMMRPNDVIVGVRIPTPQASQLGPMGLDSNSDKEENEKMKKKEEEKEKEKEKEEIGKEVSPEQTDATDLAAAKPLPASPGSVPAPGALTSVPAPGALARLSPRKDDDNTGGSSTSTGNEVTKQKWWNQPDEDGMVTWWFPETTLLADVMQKIVHGGRPITLIMRRTKSRLRKTRDTGAAPPKPQNPKTPKPPKNEKIKFSYKNRYRSFLI